MSSELPDAGDLLGLRGKTVLVTAPAGASGGRRGALRRRRCEGGVIDLDGDTAHTVASFVAEGCGGALRCA